MGAWGTRTRRAGARVPAACALLALLIGAPPRPAVAAEDVGGLVVWWGLRAGREGLVTGQVIEVTPGGPADRAGIARGDTLLAIGGVALAAPESLTHALAIAPVGVPCAIVRARAAVEESTAVVDTLDAEVAGPALAHDTLEVALDDLAPRLGAFVSSSGVGPTNAVVVDADVSVAVSLCEWAGFTLLAVRVDNRGPADLRFGPDSVSVLDGSRRVMRPVGSRDVLANRYGGRDASPAEDWAIALAGGGRTERERTSAGLTHNELREGEVPPGAHEVGLLYFAVERMAAPVEVRVWVAMREYALAFAPPPVAPAREP